MTGFIRSPYAHFGATASAAIVAVGLVTVPPERYDSVIMRTEFAAVQLQAVAATQVAALANTAPNVGSVAADPSAFTGNSALAPGAAATAAASTGGDALSSVGRELLRFVGTVLLPIWWVGFPITYPLYLAAWARQNPGVYSQPIFDFLGWAIAPYGALDNLANLLFPQAATAPTAATKSTASAADDPTLVTSDSNADEAKALGTTSTAVTEPAAAAIDGVAALGTAKAVARAEAITPQNAVALAVALVIGAAIAVVWYPTFPITLPLTYLGFSFASRILAGQSPDLGAILQVFLAIPFVIGAQAVGNPPIFANGAASARRRVPLAVATQDTQSKAENDAPLRASDAAASVADVAEKADSQPSRQRRSSQRDRAVAQAIASAVAATTQTPTAPTTATVTPPTDALINAAGPELTSDAHPAGRTSRTARAHTNTANTDAGKRTEQATANAQ